MSELPSKTANKVPPVYCVPPPTLNMPPPIPVMPAAQIYAQPPPFVAPPLPVASSYPIPPPPSEAPPSYTSVPPPQPLFLPPLNVPPPVKSFTATSIDINTSIPPPRVHADYYLKPQSVKVEVKYDNKEHTRYEKFVASKSRTELDYHKGSAPSSSREKNYKEELMSQSSSRHLGEREQYDRMRREKEKERELRYRQSRSSRSPGHSYRHRSRSPPNMSRDERIARERYYRERQRLLEDREYERRKYGYERRRSPHHRSSSRGYARYERSPSRHRYHSPRRDHHSHSRMRELSPPSRSRTRDFSPHSRSSTRDISPHSRSGGRDFSPHSSSHIRDESPFSRSRRRDMSPHLRDVSPHSRSSVRDRSPHTRTRKPLTDREKILEEYRKNYCQTSEDLIEKIEQWSKEHKSDDEDEAPKMWYRSSPAELYYKAEGTILKQTNKLEKICDVFFEKLIVRGRKARPADDELPPLKPQKAKMCHHKDDNSSSSSSSSESDDLLDEDGLQGYTDRIMLELQRKQSHPRRLHPEMWFNNTGEMNGGPLCRCSARARRHGMRHGVYAGELAFPKCAPNESNSDKLYHYRITVSPPTNFLIKAPTIIGHDEHEFLFSGFSMFSHYKLKKLPTCKVIRFNIEYTILYVEEPAPQNFTVRELDLFEEYLFTELLELVDLDLGKGTETSCSQFHFMPRFVRFLAEGGCEVLSMCEVLKYLIDESDLLIPPNSLEKVHEMDHYSWQKFVDRIKGMIVTYPGKKPCSVRVDQLDRSAPNEEAKLAKKMKTFYPEIVHFGIRPPQLSYAGNPEYQKAWRYYVKYRHLIANMAKPSYNERQKLATKEANLQEMRTQSKMKRDVTVAISSVGFHTTGLMCDVVQHAMLIPVLVRHLRFHKSLDSLESKIGYVFMQRAFLQTALTHPSYRENFGTNPDHARNSLTNCGIRQPQYGDRRIHYTRKKGIVTLINIMSRFGKHSETESELTHNERLEFLGDAVVEFLSSIHLFRMFPGLAEGGLATYRAAIVQNQHLAQLAKNIDLEQYMLYAHGSDLCRDVVMRHAMANCFEALMGALFLDAHIEVADRVFSLALWHNEPELLEVWTKERGHPLQEQEPLGDRKYIKDFEFLQTLTKFEDSIGVQFKHIRLLARAFTDRSVGFTHLTLGSNQRLEFLGDTVLQLVVSDRLYRHFPDHHEGHLSLLRSSLVNNRTQSMVCDDLDMSSYAIYNNPKAKPTTKKHKADLLEAFLGALYIDKSLEYCQAFCNACLFPRLQEFIMNQDWNDPKSKLQQCCLTLRSMEGGEPDIPLYKVIECLGPTNTRVYTVGVYFRGRRLASARGHSIQEAEMNAAEEALNCAHELFPQLDHQKRVIANSMSKKKSRASRHERERLKHKRNDDKVPKAYRLDKRHSSDSSSDNEASETQSVKSNEDSGLDSDSDGQEDNALDDVKVSSLVSDMEKIKEDLIRSNKYEELKEKCRKSDSDSDE